MLFIKDKNTDEIITVNQIFVGVFVILSLFSFSLLGFNGFLDANKQVTVRCDRTTNLCIFKEKKHFSLEKETKVPLSFLAYSNVDVIGCAKGSCRYKLLVKTKDNRYITAFYGSIDKLFLKKVSSDLNKFFKNDYFDGQKIDTLNILPATKSFEIDGGIICFLILSYFCFELFVVLCIRIKKRIQRSFF